MTTTSVDQWRGVAAETQEQFTAKLSALLRRRTRRLLADLLRPHKRKVWLYTSFIVVSVTASMAIPALGFSQCWPHSTRSAAFGLAGSSKSP